MKKLITCIYFSIAFLCFSTIYAQAYIDPSVMTYAIQAVAGVAIAVGTVVGLYWRKLTKGLRKLFRVRNNHHKLNESDEISFTDPESEKVITPESITKREIDSTKDTFLIVHGKDKIEDPKEEKESLSHKIFTVCKDLIPGILISIAITYMICYYAPLEIYMNNQSEFWFDYNTLQPQLLQMSFAVIKITVLFYIVCYAINKKLYHGVVSAGISGLVILYLQGNYFASELPGMDGGEIDWVKYTPQTEQSIILCLVVVLIVAILYRVLKEKKFSYVVDFVSILIVAMLVISLTDITKKQNGKAVKSNQYVVSKENEYNYSTNNNFIIFIVDAFDSDSFNSIVSENPDYQSVFEDFTYYPDTVCAYPYTSRSIPFIMSGKWYENQEDYQTFEAQAVNESPLLSTLENNGYRLDAYEDEFLFDTNLSRYSNLVETKSKLQNEYLLRQKEVNLALYKYAPYFLKSLFKVNLDDFNQTQAFEDTGTQAFNMMYYDYYPDLLNTEITTTDQNVFKFIHVEGAHIPFDYDENMNPIENGTYVQKQEGTITLLNQYLQKLKDAGVFDNSTILIMGDHGYDPDTADEYSTIECRNNPLLLVKAANESHEMQWNESPISYDDLQGAYQNLMNGADGNTAFDGLTEDNGARRFLLYKWSSENILTEYYQTGNATDMTTMNPSGNVYEYTGKNLKKNQEGN